MWCQCERRLEKAMNSGMENREALREMERLLREDLTPEARKDHEAAREAFQCFKFTVEMIGGRHKKRRSSIAGCGALEDRALPLLRSTNSSTYSAT